MDALWSDVTQRWPVLRLNAPRFHRVRRVRDDPTRPRLRHFARLSGVSPTAPSFVLRRSQIQILISSACPSVAKLTSVSPLQVGGEDHWTSQAGGECNGVKVVDLSYGFSQNQSVFPAIGLNGTYTGHIFSDRAVSVISEHDAATPLFMCKPRGSPAKFALFLRSIFNFFSSLALASHRVVLLAGAHAILCACLAAVLTLLCSNFARVCRCGASQHPRPD